MAFKKTDQSAYSADAPLSAAALRLAQSNAEAVMGSVVPGAGVAYDLRNAPLLVGDASQGTADFSGEAGMAFLVYPEFSSNNNARYYTVRIRLENQHPTLSMFILTRILTLAEFQGARFGQAHSRYELVGGAKETVEMTAGRVTGEIEQRSAAPYVLLISASSAMGGYELLYDPKMSGDETGLAYLSEGINALVTQPDALWDGTDAQTDDMIPRRILFGRANTSGTYDPGAFDPDAEWTGGVQPPQYQHQLSSGGSSGPNPIILIYPGTPTDYTPSPTDAMARQEMAYARVWGIEVRENDTTPATLSIDGTAHGQPASASLVQSFNTAMERKAIYGDGAICMDTDLSRFIDPGTGKPASRRQTVSQITTSWRTISEWVVGGPRLQYRGEGDTTTQVKNHYEVSCLAQWQMYINSGVPEAGIEFRAVIEDGGGDIEGDPVDVLATVTPTLRARNGAVINRDPRYLQGSLLGFTLFDSYVYRSDHTLRDVVPFSLGNSLSPKGFNTFFIKARVKDEGSITQTTGRRIRLEARFLNVPYPPNPANTGQHSICVWSAAVNYIRSNTPSDLGTD